MHGGVRAHRRTSGYLRQLQFLSFDPQDGARPRHLYAMPPQALLHEVLHGSDGSFGEALWSSGRARTGSTQPAFAGSLCSPLRGDPEGRSGLPIGRPRLTTAGRAAAPLRHLTLWQDCQRCWEHAPSARTPLLLIVRSAWTMLSCRRDAGGFHGGAWLFALPLPSSDRSFRGGHERTGPPAMRTCHANCAFCSRPAWVGENADLKTVEQPLAAAVPLLHKTLWTLILPSLAANRLPVSNLTSRATSCAARSGMPIFAGCRPV